LTWNPSTDDTGVTGYRLERCSGEGCTNFSQIASPTGTTYSNTGLNGSTNYNYRVRATDAAGNLSGYSNLANAVTQASTGGGGIRPIAFVQMNYATPSTTTSVVSVQYNATQTAGNLNVIVVGINDAVAQITSVTDSRGNTYELASGPTVLAGEASQSIYY